MTLTEFFCLNLFFLSPLGSLLKHLCELWLASVSRRLFLTSFVVILISVERTNTSPSRKRLNSANHLLQRHQIQCKHNTSVVSSHAEQESKWTHFPKQRNHVSLFVLYLMLSMIIVEEQRTWLRRFPPLLFTLRRYQVNVFDPFVTSVTKNVIEQAAAGVTRRRYLFAHLPLRPARFSEPAAHIPTETFLSPARCDRKHLLRCEMWGGEAAAGFSKVWTNHCEVLRRATTQLRTGPVWPAVPKHTVPCELFPTASRGPAPALVLFYSSHSSSSLPVTLIKGISEISGKLMELQLTNSDCWYVTYIWSCRD